VRGRPEAPCFIIPRVVINADPNVPINATLILDKRLGGDFPEPFGSSAISSPQGAQQMAGTHYSTTLEDVCALLLTSIPLRSRVCLPKPLSHNRVDPAAAKPLHFTSPTMNHELSGYHHPQSPNRLKPQPTAETDGCPTFAQLPPDFLSAFCVGNSMRLSLHESRMELTNAVNVEQEIRRKPLKLLHGVILN